VETLEKWILSHTIRLFPCGAVFGVLLFCCLRILEKLSLIPYFCRFRVENGERGFFPPFFHRAKWGSFSTSATKEKCRIVEKRTFPKIREIYFSTHPNGTFSGIILLFLEIIHRKSDGKSLLFHKVIHILWKNIYHTVEYVELF
jgi:hypothetical protein